VSVKPLTEAGKPKKACNQEVALSYSPLAFSSSLAAFSLQTLKKIVR
jgi:hypothetical protein